MEFNIFGSKSRVSVRRDSTVLRLGFRYVRNMKILQ